MSRSLRVALALMAGVSLLVSPQTLGWDDDIDPEEALPIRTSEGWLSHADLRRWLVRAGGERAGEQALQLDGLSVTLGQSEGRFTQGRAVPILPAEGDGPPLGLVFLGEGQVVFSVPEPGAGQHLANRLSLELGMEEELGELPSQGRLKTSFTALALRSRVPQVVQLHQAPAAGPVTPEEAERALALWRERASQRALPLTDRLRVELLREDPARARSLAWYRTGLPSEPWVLATHDVSGLTSSTREGALWLQRAPDALLELGRHRLVTPEHPVQEGAGLMGALPFPARAELGGQPGPEAVVLPQAAWVKVELEREGELHCRARWEVELELKAVGGPLQLFHIELPKVESVPGSWSVDRLEVAGAAPFAFSELEPELEVDQLHGVIGVVLPRALREGYTARAFVSWQGTWARSKRRDPCQGQLRFLPTLRPGRVGDPMRYTLNVGLPAEDRLFAIAPGDTRFLGTRDGLGWTVFLRQDEEVVAPVLQVGKWGAWHEDDGDPEVHVHLRGWKLRPKPWGKAVLDIADFYRTWFGDYPLDEVRLVQHRGRWESYLGYSAGYVADIGHVYGGPGIRQASERPYAELGELAHRMAGAWWGQQARVVEERDIWIPDALGEVASCMYLAARVHEQACARRMEQARRYWEGPLSPEHASLTHGAREAWGHTATLYGAYVLYAMLRPRIGDDPFMQAMGELTEWPEGEPLRTEQLREVFEQVSGQDLRAFFDFWVHSGYLPDLEVQAQAVQEDGGWRVKAQARSSVPHGSFDVPLRVRSGDGQYSLLWMTVSDGSGELEGPLLSGEAPPHVQLDPARVTLTPLRTFRGDENMRGGAL